MDVPAHQASGTGYVQRRGRPRLPHRASRSSSAVLLNDEERELLERLAVQDDVLLSDVWRSALRHYAQVRGVLRSDAGEGVSAAA